ncbi:G protein pathway suppressor 1 [Obelidium mucronatum]|nr:G protein pathway suppressor 1 [Obelidium mucronatum]
MDKDPQQQQNARAPVPVPASAAVFVAAIDLDALVANYKGHSRIARLEFIAEVCPSLAKESLTLALEDIKASTLNTTKYAALAHRLFDLSGGSYKLDQSWIEETAKVARSKLEKLDAELKNYKSNLIKESIRMGHQDLGDHFYACGDLASALKCYSRTRDYCSTAKNVLDMCFNVIQVSVDQKNFSHVQSYVIKAESTPDPAATPVSATTPAVGTPGSIDTSRQLMLSKLKCCMGLVNLDAGKYKSAARSFLEVGPEIIGRYSEVISATDIANYLTLFSLATFDRADIKSKVIDNPVLKQFLELADPSLREEVLGGFYNARYGVCLEALERLKATFLLDMYLNPHIPHLYSLIRRRAIIQYISPFEAVDLKRMSAAFGGDGSDAAINETELEVAGLVTEGIVKARIDSHNKVLRINKSDQRSVLFDKTIEMGEEYAKQANFLLLRVQMMKQDMFVQAPVSHMSAVLGEEGGRGERQERWGNRLMTNLGRMMG